MSHSNPQLSQTKTCTKCGRDLPRSEYHRRRRSADGLHSECKACRVGEKRAWYAANRKRVAETDRAWYAANKEHVAETSRAWKKANPEKTAEYTVRTRAKYPDRLPARNAVTDAVRRGKMPSPRDLLCAVCDAPAEQYHHHKGYSPKHRLDVVAVCVTCHKALHAQAPPK